MSEFSVEPVDGAWVVIDASRGHRLGIARVGTEAEAIVIRDYEGRRKAEIRGRIAAAEIARRERVEAAFAAGRALVEDLSADAAKARLLAEIEQHRPQPAESGDCPTCHGYDRDNESFPCDAFDRLTGAGQ